MPTGRSRRPRRERIVRSPQGATPWSDTTHPSARLDPRVTVGTSRTARPDPVSPRRTADTIWPVPRVACRVQGSAPARGTPQQLRPTHHDPPHAPRADRCRADRILWRQGACVFEPTWTPAAPDLRDRGTGEENGKQGHGRFECESRLPLQMSNGVRGYRCRLPILHTCYVPQRRTAHGPDSIDAGPREAPSPHRAAPSIPAGASSA